MLAYLRVLLNPADSLSAKRIVNVPTRGIGSVTVDKIAALEEEAGGFFPVCRVALERNLLPNQASEKVRAFVALMDAINEDIGRAKPAEMAAKVMEMTGYAPMLRDDPSSEAQDRLQNLEELLRAMEQAGESGQTLAEYLEQIALVTDLDAYDSRADRVTLMTLHSAKGLEFPYVFMTALVENIFPHSRSVESRCGAVV
ncbi:MAG TPA: 3'-5' exonuclease [Terriglobales bacterium]|nr:3'-5' exonuclease [Terriglobales bacterium]